MKRQKKWLIALILSGLISVTIFLSLMIGSTNYSFQTIVDAAFHFDPENMEHQILLNSRVPRALGALLVGAAISMSGSLMQGMTRNYLASPSIMGVSDGSIFAITLSMIFLPQASSITLIFLSFLGSLFGMTLVYVLATLIPGGMSPISLAILGTVLGMFLSGVSQALSTYFQVSQSISFWYNTRLHQIDPVMLKIAFPVVLIGLIGVFYVTRSITAISLGDDVALGLGVPVIRMKIVTIISVALLTGISVALVGKVTFIGLVIPHVVRYLIGEDYKKIVPMSALAGAIFLALADVISRVVNPPFEMPVGVVTALVGVPYFLYLIRRNGGQQRA
ncbi:FecCD family ABC transporter permease [Vagococcus silagei]|uniref:Iron ABC transporter permease n=1 Tax=Vagococcus silagei TaxID=2508885 RepID=A0A4S3B069_9ENTE|nr:iron ABC transporter permease [Vagococcus silagei]THB60401.1 iron ABC transporter permease [Vagococcus silagei]